MIKMKQIFTVFLLALSIGTAQAIDFKNSEQLLIPADQTVSNEIWHIAQRIEFKGTALNDLFLASSEKLVLSGDFKDDIWGGAVSASFQGNCSDSVRLLAQNSITIDGYIGNNLIAAVPNINNATVKLGTNSNIRGSAICFGDNVILEGQAANLTVYANRATIGGRIEGNLTVIATDIVVLNNTRISGNLNYLSDEELLVNNTVQIGGKITPLPAPIKPGTNWKSILFKQGYFFIAALLVTLPFLNLFPGFATYAVTLFRISPWRCLLIGFAAMFIIPFCCITLCSSLIGLPLGLILAGWYASLLYLSKIVFALIFGALIFRRRQPATPKSPLVAACAGLLIIYLLTSIEFIRAPIWLMIMMYGTGAMILATFKKVRLVIPPPHIPHPLSDDKKETNTGD